MAGFPEDRGGVREEFRDGGRLPRVLDRGAIWRFIEARYPIYALADVTVESREVPHEIMADAVIRALIERGVG